MIKVIPEILARHPTSLEDEAGNVAFVTKYGQQLTGHRRDEILCRFEYNNSTYDVTNSVTGTGTSSNSGSLAIVSTGAGVGTSKFVTKRDTAYRPAQEVYAFFSAVYSSGEANTSQSAGIYDANDGMFFGYSGTTFGLNIRKGASDTFVAQSSWNKDKLDGTKLNFTLDPTKLNQYMVSYGWLGISPISFYVYCGEANGWVLVHVIDYTNTQTTVSILSPCLPVTWEVARTSGSGAKTVGICSIAAGSIQGVHSHAGHRVFAGTKSKTLVAGVETYIATFQNKSTFQSLANKVSTEAAFFGASTDGTKSVNFKFYRNSTVTTPTYVDVDTNNSVTAVDTVGTWSGGTFEFSIPMAKVDTSTLDLGAGHIHLELLPGETMSITGTSAGASDVEIAFRWEEYFS
jgi:hypothetical protein